MRTNFDQLPDMAKVWVYQSNTPFTQSQLSIINELSNVFLSQWESHNIPVEGSIDVIDNMFIRIGAYTDEDSMCGRAQDSQVRLIKELEGELGVELTNRMLFIFDVDDQPIVIHMNDLEDRVKSSMLDANTMFYNTLVHTKKEFNNSWKIKAGDSWLERYFN